MPLGYGSARAMAKFTEDLPFNWEAIKAVYSPCFHLVYKCEGHGLLSYYHCADASTALLLCLISFPDSIKPVPSMVLLRVVTGCCKWIFNICFPSSNPVSSPVLSLCTQTVGSLAFARKQLLTFTFVLMSSYWPPPGLSCHMTLWSA